METTVIVVVVVVCFTVLLLSRRARRVLANLKGPAGFALTLEIRRDKE